MSNPDAHDAHDALAETHDQVLHVLAALESRAQERTRPPEIPGFEIERLIGRGGLGSVYLARDEKLGRPVALKLLRRGSPADAHARVLAEARKAAGLSDPAIVTVHSVVEDGPSPCIVMEYVDGYTIDRTQHLTFKQRAQLLQGVARALALAHRRGIIHRDLKPDNVLVTPGLEPKVLDFGLAVSVTEAGAPSTWFEGTPLFASPEQARGDALTPASDVFSFGSLMFSVLTGRPPFDGETAREILEKIKTESPPYPRDFARGIPDDLQAICLAGLTHDPRKRPTAGTLALDLGRYLAGEPVHTRPALYSDLLRQRIAEHSTELQTWHEQGLISKPEHDRLSRVYRRIVSDEDHWIVDARKLTLAPSLLYTGVWTVVVAGVLLVTLARADLPAQWRWLAPAIGCAYLLGVGLWSQGRRDSLAASALLASAMLLLVPTTLTFLGEWGWLAQRPDGVQQLLSPPYSNHQVFCSCLLGLSLSLMVLGRLGMTGFAYTSALLLCASYLGALLLGNWLGREPEIQALETLPLVLLVAVALYFEAHGRVRWAPPFHVLAFMALVLSLDVMAHAGPTLRMLGLASSASPRAQPFSLALNGLLFIVIMGVTERAQSLDLRRASSIFEFVAPPHLLVPLYLNVRQQHAAGHDLTIDVGLYLGAVALLLALGPWKSRRGILFSGLLGIGLGSFLLMDLNLVDRATFVLSLGAAGLLLALGTYVFLHLRVRARAGGAAEK